MPGPELVAERFQAGTPAHYVLLVICVLGAVGAVLLGRRLRGTPAAQRTSRIMAVVVACLAVFSEAVQLTPSNFDLGTSLPLNLSDLAVATAIWALWTHDPVPVSLTYHWGLTLTLMAILTPSLGQVFPDPRFIAFWYMHFVPVWAALYFTFGLGIAPTWRTYRVTVAVTAAWAVVVYVINVILDVNYGYLVRTPRAATLLDLFGPWPVYIFAALAILLLVWALLTWPWVVNARRREAATSG
jgi:hypothetical integral membrane protein (TIGR02206 family)